MCGIAGWIDWNRAEPDGDSLRAMTRRFRHRGPDGEDLTFVAILPNNSGHNGHFRPSPRIGIPISYRFSSYLSQKIKIR